MVRFKERYKLEWAPLSFPLFNCSVLYYKHRHDSSSSVTPVKEEGIIKQLHFTIIFSKIKTHEQVLHILLKYGAQPDR